MENSTQTQAPKIYYKFRGPLWKNWQQEDGEAIHI